MSRVGDTLREPFPGYPPPLTTRPEGLLSMLGLQTNGRYPQHLAADNLTVNIDLLRWYCESVATFKTGNINTTGAGNFVTDANLTVPTGEHWLLLQFSVQGNALIAAGATLQLGRTNSSGGTYVPLGERTESEANSIVSANHSAWATGILLRPSVELGVFQYRGVAAIALSYTLRYVRLQT